MRLSHRPLAVAAIAFLTASSHGIAQAPGGPVAAYNTGAAYARRGMADSAFLWLERTARMGFSDTAFVNGDSDLASLRGDPRFAQLEYHMTHAPAPCESDSAFHAFDFWVGDWRVTTQAGRQVGTSHVEKVSGGCALLENWRSVQNAEGKSLNTIDPQTHQWQQYWIGQAGGPTAYLESEWQGKSLAFLARIPAPTNTPAALGRLTFTPNDDGTVRQHGERSVDGGKTWTTTYDFVYHRVP